MKLSWLQTDYNVSRKLKKITFFYSLLPKVKLQCNDIECVGCQAVGTRVLMRNNLMLYIVIFSLFICGSIESRFDRIHRTTNIRKEPKKIVRYLLFPPSLTQRGKPDYLNIFFPHLNSIVGLFFLFIYLLLYLLLKAFTSLRDSTHPEHMQVPWFTLPRYTPSLSYIGRSISPSLPSLNIKRFIEYSTNQR